MNKLSGNREKIGFIVIIFSSVFLAVVISLIDPVSQDIKYHAFGDQRDMFGIPNFWNVISNIPFLLVGVFGLYAMFISKKLVFISEIKLAYILFFLGVALVSVGSGYYHLWPDNATLVWDRLPMTIAFMALFSIVTAEFISVRLGKILLWPLILFGIYSVLYWNYTESIGTGDLRLYGLVQFLPVIAIPLILIFFKSKFTLINGYWLLVCMYVLAKIFEHYDAFVYNILWLISGHSIKHVVAAIGILFLINSYIKRELN